MKYCLLILLFPLFTMAQPCRYQIRMFSGFTKTANVQYATAPAINAPYLVESFTSNQNLVVDIFQPNSDTAQKRALIIFAHSGGFLNGSKNNEDMQALCDSFAHRGYVTASMQYRLGFNPLSSNASERAVWRGIQDASAAVRFFKQNAGLYKIDTTKIFLWGSSAGAFMAMGLPFVDDTERPASTYSGSFRPNLGCKDCSGNVFTHTSSIAGTISCWGATGDTAWIKNNNNTPVLLFHGSGDATVPFAEGYPFGLPTIAYVRGSQQINEQLNRTSIYHEYYPEIGLGHEYWGTSNGTFIPAGPTVYWNDILTKAKDFILGRMTGLPACILPVSLSGFAANIVHEKTNLYWNTSSELNLVHIIVERSADGIIYHGLTTVLPKGNNGNGAYYTATDSHPYSGINYYRLKLVDFNGSFTYSDIVTVKTNPKAVLITQLYPNPVQNHLNIELQSAQRQNITVSIFDFTGKLFSTNFVKLNTGINKTVIPFENAQPGIYAVQITNMLDGSSMLVKIVKQ